MLRSITAVVDKSLSPCMHIPLACCPIVCQICLLRMGSSAAAGAFVIPVVCNSLICFVVMFCSLPFLARQSGTFHLYDLASGSFESRGVLHCLVDVVLLPHMTGCSFP